MRWCIIVAVTLGLSITDAVSFAQQNGLQGHGEAQRLAPLRPSSGHIEYQDAGYFAKSGVVRFQLIQGRLQLDAPRHRKGSQTHQQDGVYESITVTAVRGIPSVHYVCQTEEQQLTLSVANATDLRIESLLTKSGSRGVLKQAESGPILWTIHHNDLKEEYRGSTLLHINQADSVGFDQHCGLLITRLLQGQSLLQIEAATTAAMFKQLSQFNPANPSRDAVLSCVERLRSVRRSHRALASKQLINWGSPILPIIDTISHSTFTNEQIERLNIVRSRLKRRESDTPTSLATMLINDPSHWQAIARDLDDQQIQLANKHLSRTGLKTLPPAAEIGQRIAQERSRLR